MGVGGWFDGEGRALPKWAMRRSLGSRGDIRVGCPVTRNSWLSLLILGTKKRPELYCFFGESALIDSFFAFGHPFFCQIKNFSSGFGISTSTLTEDAMQLKSQPRRIHPYSHAK